MNSEEILEVSEKFSFIFVDGCCSPNPPKWHAAFCLEPQWCWWLRQGGACAVLSCHLLRGSGAVVVCQYRETRCGPTSVNFWLSTCKQLVSVAPTSVVGLRPTPVVVAAAASRSAILRDRLVAHAKAPKCAALAADGCHPARTLGRSRESTEVRCSCTEVRWLCS